MLLEQLIIGFAAGKDVALLAHAPRHEKAKYYGLGLIILAISLLALFSMAMSMSLVYPPAAHGHDLAEFGRQIVICTISLVWGLVVFNYYRFSLSLDTVQKTKIQLTDLWPFLVRFGFGIVLGIAVGIPVTVMLLQKEIANEMTPQQVEILETLKAHSVAKYEDPLNTEYARLLETLTEVASLKDKLASEKKLKSANPITLLRLDEQIGEKDLQAKKIKAEIDELRTLSQAELLITEIEYKSRNSLINSIQKTIHKNPYLTALICLFVLLALTFPALYQLYSLPGIYDYLTEYEGHYILAEHGVIAKGGQVYSRTHEVNVPYFSKARAILKLEKQALFEKLK